MSSNLGQVQKDIYTFFDDAWDDRTPVAWPNAAFVAPMDEPWVDIALSWGDGVVTSMAPTNRNTLVGVVYVNCYCIEDEGQGELMGIADAVRDVFNRVVLALSPQAVRFDAPSAPKPVNGRFNQVSISIPFTVDETVT